MSQQTSGLRFDIYERVHLPEDTVGISELTGIELTPEISVVEQGEQAVLKGYLALYGTYVGDTDNQSEEQFTHRIPVEITLPLNRVKNVNDIKVEIETFDVDVITPKVLNVTGVLTLQGIETVSAAESLWREEEVLFSHRVEQQELAAPAPAPSPQNAPHSAAFTEDVPAVVETPAANEKPAEEALSNAPAAAAAEEKEEAKEAKAEESEAFEALEKTNAEVFEAQAAEEEEKPEKQEIKIAFSGKPAKEQEEKIGVNKIMAMASSGAPVKEQPAEAEAVENAQSAAVQAAETADGKDRLEWKKRFLQPSSAESFRKVRMVIVQKEDTIESIAERYKKNAREIMLYNRINEDYLQEGQIVYIP